VDCGPSLSSNSTKKTENSRKKKKGDVSSLESARNSKREDLLGGNGFSILERCKLPANPVPEGKSGRED